jgi:6-methylsalicylate decarboxylase
LVQLPNTIYKGKLSREQVHGKINRFYYDTAQVANPVTMAAMVKLGPVAQIVYGIDFPYRTAEDHTKGLEAIFSGSDLQAIDRDNAIRILPRLKAT